MSIEIDFTLSSSWNSGIQTSDLSTISEQELRYEAFLGDIVLSIDGVDFSTDWGWVPILDFAMALQCVVADLAQGKPISVFEFTESDHEIRFLRDGDSVVVFSTYRKGEARISLDELRSAVSSFARSVYDRMCEESPSVKRNKTIENWSAAKFPIE